MAKSETGDILVGVVLHGDTPEEREEFMRALSQKIMELSVMIGDHGVQVKRTHVSYHSRSARPLFKKTNERE